MSKTCIIIPCFNEEDRLPIEIFSRYIESSSVCFLFVDDGSTDKTADVLHDLEIKHPQSVQSVHLETNSGKAEAVRQGIMKALEWQPFEFVGYFDADLATPLNEIDHIRHYLQQDNNYTFAMGSRVKRLGSTIHRTALRHYLGRIFATTVSWMHDIPVYDSQCGAKLIESKLAKIIFNEPFISKWLFDFELILRTQQLKGLDAIIEVPLRSWKEKKGSKINALQFLKVPRDLLKIKNKY